MDSTSVTLLQKLRQQGQPEAWERFVRLYTPLLRYWARQRCGLQEHDADDLVQDVLAGLVRKLPAFTYEPGKSFRAWLRQVLLNQWRDHLRRDEQAPAAGEVGLSRLVSPQEEDRFEAEDLQFLVRRALEVMRAEFEPATWQACWAVVAEGRPAAEAATRLGLSVNAVYIARCRVLRRLREDLAGLLD
jgi:RNA polymerase sigma-70 factor (ECF subfamily)